MTTRSDVINNVPPFTEEQIRWLDTVFPENTSVPNDSSELQRRLGNREVVRKIMYEMDKIKQRHIKQEVTNGFT